MVSNCKRYNGQDTEFWEAADNMEKAIAELFAKKGEGEGASSSASGATKS